MAPETRISIEVVLQSKISVPETLCKDKSGTVKSEVITIEEESIHPLSPTPTTKYSPALETTVEIFFLDEVIIYSSNTDEMVDEIKSLTVTFKNATDEKATVRKAFTQIQNYKKAVPSIFYYNALCIISDGIDAKTSSLSAPFTRFLSWKAPKESNNLSINNKVNLSIAAEPTTEYDKTELQLLTEYMLQKEVLLKLMRYCTVFESEEKKDEKKSTGLIAVLIDCSFLYGMRSSNNARTNNSPTLYLCFIPKPLQQT